MALSSSLIIALLLAIAVEITVAFFFGYRKNIEIAAVASVNLITNPLLNYLLLLNARFGLIQIGATMIVFLELAIVIIEWLLLFYVLGGKSKRLLILSATMNFCSYIIGLVMLK